MSNKSSGHTFFLSFFNFKIQCNNAKLVNQLYQNYTRKYETIHIILLLPFHSDRRKSEKGEGTFVTRIQTSIILNYNNTRVGQGISHASIIHNYVLKIISHTLWVVPKCAKEGKGVSLPIFSQFYILSIEGCHLFYQLVHSFV